MNSFTHADFNLTILDEEVCARDIVEKNINELSASGKDDAFYVADLGDVVKKHLHWTRALPRVQPFYAVKCNPSRAVIMALATMGAGFDCASKSEIQLVQSVGVEPGRIIYANTCKQTSHLQYALEHGITMMTFDNEAELEKIAGCHGHAKLVLRISTDDSKSLVRLSNKYGAPLKKARALLERACELGLDVIGVSFHVGSGCTDPQAYTHALSDARYVFDLGAELGYNMNLLDIGGGFPGTEDTKLKFEEYTAVLNPVLDKYFPANSGVKIIAEPGRYYVASAFTLVVNIIAKNVVMQEQSPSDENGIGTSDRTLMYYVNDGIHGSFHCSFTDGSPVQQTLVKYSDGYMRKLECPHMEFGETQPDNISQSPKQDELWHPSSIWGHTCDGHDCLVERTLLPELQVGDWLLFENWGAYSVAAYSGFNGFQRPDTYYFVSRVAWQYLQQVHGQGMPVSMQG